MLGDCRRGTIGEICYRSFFGRFGDERNDDLRRGVQAYLHGQRSRGHRGVNGDANLAVAGFLFGWGVGVSNAQGSGEENHAGAQDGYGGCGAGESRVQRSALSVQENRALCAGIGTQGSMGRSACCAGILGPLCHVACRVFSGLVFRISAGDAMLPAASIHS